MDHLRIRQLRLLIEIAERSSLGDAARALNMTQPAATKALKQLEEYFGTPLAERGRKGSTLSSAGLALYPHAKKVVSATRAAEFDIRELLKGDAGTIRVGALPVALPTLLPEAFRKLHEKHPRINIHITSGDSSFLFEMLRTEQIDLLIGRLWTGEDADFDGRILYSSSFALVARNEHPIFELAQPRLVDAIEYEWIMPPERSFGHAALDSVFEKTGVKPPVSRIETSSYVLTRELMRGSDSLAAIDRSALGNDFHDGLVRIVDLDLEAILSPIGVLSLRTHNWTPAEQHFLRALTDAACQLFT